jgi:uncharacterized protein YqhQ
MDLWKHQTRFLAALQLLPALEGGEETLVGGQAVMEGVMMRSPHAWGIAVRKADGTLVTHAEGLDKPSEKHPWMGWPFLRGVITLGLAMKLGYRALQFSANVALEEEQKDTPREKRLEFSGWLAALNIVLSVGFFIVMYKAIPWFATTQLKQHYAVLDNRWWLSLIDGAIRIALFLFFIWMMSRMKDIHRVFQYHGAEHKTVFAFESGQAVDVRAAQGFPTWHPRCGTSFLMTVMLISIPIYMAFPRMDFWAGFGLRLLLLPVIAGTSYEIIRFAARHGSSLFALLTRPGLWLQRITTQPCDDTQVECAIRALDEAFAVEKQRGGQLVLS